jgi:hypothetical protein
VQPYVTDFSLALVAGPVVVALALAALTQAFRHQPPSGWRVVKPSLGQWFTSLGSSAFASLIIWVWIYVGSARHDGAFQMNVAWWLAMAFGLGALVVSMQMLRIARGSVSWRSDKLAVGRGDGLSLRTMHDIERVDPVSLGRVRLHFQDGLVLPIDISANGADGLLQSVYAIKGMDDYFDPPEH